MSRLFDSKRKMMIAMSAILISIIIVLSLSTTVFASKTRTNDDQFRVISITIESGDTLWEIASKYFTSHYDNVDTYIKVIMDANHLTNTKIKSGMSLVVPYYCNL